MEGYAWLDVPSRQARDLTSERTHALETYQGIEKHPGAPERGMPLLVDDRDEDLRPENLHRYGLVPIGCEIDTRRCLKDDLSSGTSFLDRRR